MFLHSALRCPNGILSNSGHGDNNHHGNHSGPISPSTPPSIEEALKIIHDTERPHASLGMGGPDGFYLHGAEPSEPPGAHGAHGEGDDTGSTKARPNDHEPNSVSTDEVDTGIHVRTEDIQSLDEDSSSLRDYSDIDPDCEATTRSCPNYERPDRDRNRDEGPRESERGEGGARGSPCPSSAPTLPRSHTMSPASSSAGSVSGLVRMTSFAEQKFRKLEGRSSGGTTPESSDHTVPYTHPTKTTPSQVASRGGGVTNDV